MVAPASRQASASSAEKTPPLALMGSVPPVVWRTSATIRSVSRYYKGDRQINKLLTEICRKDFAAANEDRRREVMVHTKALLQEGLNPFFRRRVRAEQPE